MFYNLFAMSNLHPSPTTTLDLFNSEQCTRYLPYFERVFHRVIDSPIASRCNIALRRAYALQTSVRSCASEQRLFNSTLNNGREPAGTQGTLEPSSEPPFRQASSGPPPSILRTNPAGGGRVPLLVHGSAPTDGLRTPALSTSMLGTGYPSLRRTSYTPSRAKGP